eukprot:gene3780-560_t
MSPKSEPPPPAKPALADMHASATGAAAHNSAAEAAFEASDAARRNAAKAREAIDALPPRPGTPIQLSDGEGDDAAPALSPAASAAAPAASAAPKKVGKKPVKKEEKKAAGGAKKAAGGARKGPRCKTEGCTAERKDGYPKT